MQTIPNMTSTPTFEPADVEVGTAWPAELDLVLSALEAGRTGWRERRGERRRRHRVRAEYALFAERHSGECRELFTRDADGRGLGFVCRDALPLGYGGMVSLTSPGGHDIEVAATVYRCRPCANGWFEGTLYFHDDVDAFAPVDDWQ